MPDGLRLSRVLATNFVVALVFTCAATVLAQSGRRAPKPAPAPAAIPEPTPIPKQPAEKEKPALTLVIGIDRHSGLPRVPLYFYDSVLRSCAERLNDSTSVKVDLAQRDMSRGDAVNRAKAEQEGHVVWLQLRPDAVGADSRGDANLSEISIEYWVFAPATAKIVTSGHTYQGYRKAGVIVGPTTSGRRSIVDSEYLLKQAARDAAERILAAFKIHTGRDTLP